MTRLMVLSIFCFFVLGISQSGFGQQDEPFDPMRDDRTNPLKQKDSHWVVNVYVPEHERMPKEWKEEKDFPIRVDELKRGGKLYVRYENMRTGKCIEYLIDQPVS